MSTLTNQYMTAALLQSHTTTPPPAPPHSFTGALVSTRFFRDYRLLIISDHFLSRAAQYPCVSGYPALSSDSQRHCRTLAFTLSDSPCGKSSFSPGVYRLGYGPGIDTKIGFFFSFYRTAYHGRLPLPAFVGTKGVGHLYNSSAGWSEPHGSRPALRIVFARRPSLQWFGWAAYPWLWIRKCLGLGLVSRDTWLYRLIESTTLHFTT